MVWYDLMSDTCIASYLVSCHKHTWADFLARCEYVPISIRDVTINREPVEKRFKHVTIQIGWDAKRIPIKLGVGVYTNVCLRGNYCL